MSVKTYNPKSVTIACGNHIVTGYADDSFVTIEANGDGITKDSANANKGSNLTICGFNGKLSATDGCIDIKATDMLKLLSYLDSSKKPVVIIK